MGRSKLLSKVAAEPREVEFQSGEMLAELVVEFPGDPPTFSLLGFEGPSEIFNTGLLRRHEKWPSLAPVVEPLPCDSVGLTRQVRSCANHPLHGL